jgi:hypothetical protein
MFMHPYISYEIARARQGDLLEDASRQRLAGRLRARPGTRHHGGRALVSALAAVAALVLVVVLAGCGQGGTSTGDQTGGTGGGGVSGQPTLAGEWVGTVPADEGDCGPGSGEWIFDPDNGTYQFDAIYDSGECGYQSNGTYQVQGNSIYFQPQDESAFSAIYSFDDGALKLCDVPDTAKCNHYYKQPMQ